MENDNIVVHYYDEVDDKLIDSIFRDWSSKNNIKLVDRKSIGRVDKGFDKSANDINGSHSELIGTKLFEILKHKDIFYKQKQMNNKDWELLFFSYVNYLNENMKPT
jgi:hypothetical protein